MKGPLGMFSILVGVACIMIAAYPWLYAESLPSTDPRPFHDYFVDEGALASCRAIAAVGFSMIGVGAWLCSSTRMRD